MARAHETHRKGVPTCYAATAEDWRLWLEHHHRETSGVWLIIYHKDRGVPSVTYDQAVDEALCFGWGYRVARKRAYHRTTNSWGVRRFANLLSGKELTGVNQVWVSDITIDRVRSC